MLTTKIVVDDPSRYASFFTDQSDTGRMQTDTIDHRHCGLDELRLSDIWHPYLGHF
jgi:hypothetical protein